MGKTKIGAAIVGGGIALLIGVACDGSAPFTPADAGPPPATVDAGDAASDASTTTLLSDAELSQFSGSYRSDCGDSPADAGATYNFVGFEPVAPGAYPVFIYTVGTYAGHDGTAYDAPDSLIHVREMARRGVVAVSVGYANGNIPLTCAEIDAKAACIYRDTPNSAMRATCSREKAACTAKGVVVAGESQGAMLALRSQNHYIPDGIKGVWGRSVPDVEELGYRECMETSPIGGRSLPNARLWVTNGADDPTPGTGLSTLQRVTGWPEDAVTHRDSDADHGGYFQVQDSDLQPGHTHGADHVFNRYPDNLTTPIAWDSNWAPPATTPWSLNASLDWLYKRVTP